MKFGLHGDLGDERLSPAGMLFCTKIARDDTMDPNDVRLESTDPTHWVTLRGVHRRVRGSLQFLRWTWATVCRQQCAAMRLSGQFLLTCDRMAGHPGTHWAVFQPRPLTMAELQRALNDAYRTVLENTQRPSLHWSGLIEHEGAAPSEQASLWPLRDEAAVAFHAHVGRQYPRPTPGPT